MSWMPETCFELFKRISDRQIKSVLREQTAITFCKVRSFLVLMLRERTFWVENEYGTLFMQISVGVGYPS